MWTLAFGGAGRFSRGQQGVQGGNLGCGVFDFGRTSHLSTIPDTAPSGRLHRFDKGSQIPQACMVGFVQPIGMLA